MKEGKWREGKREMIKKEGGEEREGRHKRKGKEKKIQKRKKKY